MDEVYQMLKMRYGEDENALCVLQNAKKPIFRIAKSLVGQPSGGSNPLHSAIMTRFQGIGKTDALFLCLQ